MVVIIGGYVCTKSVHTIGSMDMKCGLVQWRRGFFGDILRMDSFGYQALDQA